MVNKTIKKYAVLTNIAGYTDIDVFDTKNLAHHYMRYLAYHDFVSHLRSVANDSELDASAKELMELVKFNNNKDTIEVIVDGELCSRYEVVQCNYYDAFELEE